MAGRLPVVVIVGRPNVGKSTLFNRLLKRRVAVVEDHPGVTRDRLYGEAQWDGKRFTVVDTGGIVYDAEDPLIDQVRVQAEIALQEADVILFLTEATAGVTPGDIELADRLRGSKKPVLIVVNKADNSQREVDANEFYSLGVGDVYAVSSLHGRGVSELLDEVAKLVPEPPEVVEEQEEIRLAILGKPNVGKSSLLNAFTGEQRVIVSHLPGTTRDAIDTLLEYKGEKFRIIDTAGLRRPGKTQGSVEFYMAHRAARALERAECALVVIDGKQGLTDGDKRVAKMTHDAAKACVLVVNKWDLQEPPDGQFDKRTPLKKDFERVVHIDVPELTYAPVRFTSAKLAKGLEPILDTALSALESYNFRIATGPLNKLIQEAVYDRPHTSKGKALRIYYATQVGTRPPTFALFCNDPDLVHFSYLRYLENKFRQKYVLAGTPIRWVLRSSHEEKQKKKKKKKR